jgi:hypothetical protein
MSGMTPLSEAHWPRGDLASGLLVWTGCGGGRADADDMKSIMQEMSATVWKL